MNVWGELKDDEGNAIECKMHGPEGGVIWTSLLALAAVKRILSGEYTVGYQTPASVFGPDFVLDCEGVVRGDIEVINKI